MTLAIRPMTRADLDTAIDWAATEGWNPGLDDGDCFFAADPGGFLLGDVDGTPAATISVVRYGAAFGFLGFYIVAPEQRGHGHGLAIWRAGLAALGARTVGLDGVVDQQDNYRRSGFVLAHRNVRFGGPVDVPAPDDAGLVPLTDLAFDTLAAYDRQHFPAPREAFLACWFKPGRRRGFAYLDDGTLAGYGVMRECRAGWKIGPLFAAREAVADTLFRRLAAEVPDGQPLYLDQPEPNTTALALAARYDLVPVFETARMYKGPAPALPLDRIFGITTFELG